jgi:hypothetical protein
MNYNNATYSSLNHIRFNDDTFWHNYYHFLLILISRTCIWFNIVHTLIFIYVYVGFDCALTDFLYVWLCAHLVTLLCLVRSWIFRQEMKVSLFVSLL